MNKIGEIDKKIQKTVDNEDKKVVKSVRRRGRPSQCSPSRNKPSALRRKVVPVTLQKRYEIEDPDPTMHYHLTKTSNVRRYIKGGYDVVEQKTHDQLRGTYAASQIGETATQDLGKGESGVWLQMPLEMWEAQQQEKLQKIRETEEMIKNPDYYLQQKDPTGVMNGRYYSKSNSELSNVATVIRNRNS